MKRFLLSILLTLSLVASSCAANTQKPLQHATMHYLLFQAGTEEWYCTGTAIGPHAILTDQHCDDEKGNAIFVAIDALLADKPKTYAVSKRYFDQEDHMIIVVPELSFDKWFLYRPETYLPPIQGEHVYYWGNPERVRNLYREGYMAGTGDLVIDLPFPAKSPKGFYFVMVAGPGDSGAAIYAEDGRIVSLLTGHSGEIAVGFPLAFTPAQVAEATK